MKRIINGIRRLGRLEINYSRMEESDKDKIVLWMEKFRNVGAKLIVQKGNRSDFYMRFAPGHLGITLVHGRLGYDQDSSRIRDSELLFHYHSSPISHCGEFTTVHIAEKTEISVADNFNYHLFHTARDLARSLVYSDSRHIRVPRNLIACDIGVVVEEH